MAILLSDDASKTAGLAVTNIVNPDQILGSDLGLYFFYCQVPYKCKVLGQVGLSKH